MARTCRFFSLFLTLIVVQFTLPQPVLAGQEPVLQELAKTLKEDKKVVIGLTGKSPIRKKLSYSIV